MFKIEYKLRRGNSDYHAFHPDPGNENHNIFIFRGSNGLGKSTVMQVLSIGMFGLNSEELSLEIKNKMKRLIDDDTKEFSFLFSISSIDKKIEIKSSLKDKSIDGLRVLVNGILYNKTAFTDRFQLIFDVPDEITKKLISSLIVIKSDIGDYIHYTKTYLNDLQSQYEIISSYDKKNERLNTLKKRLTDEVSESRNYSQRLKYVAEEYAKLRKSYVVKKFNELNDQIEFLSRKIEELEKRVNPKTQKFKQTKFSNSKHNFEDSLTGIKFILNDLEKNMGEIDVLKNLVELKSLINRINRLNKPEDFSESFFNRNISSLSAITQKLADDRRNIPSKDENELELIENIISVLKKYVTINPEIPGTNGKSLNQFLSDLGARKTLLSDKLAEKMKFLLLKRKITDLKNSFVDLRAKWKKISSSEEENQEDGAKLKKELEELVSNVADLQKNQLDIIDEYNSLLDAERIIDYELVDEEEYKSTKSEFDELKRKIYGTTEKIKITRSLLKEYIGTSDNPPKYTKEKLDQLTRVASGIQVKLGDWRQFIDNMSGLSIANKSNISISAVAFYSALGKYLANILEFVFHEGRRWVLKEIDLIKETFIVEDGFSITFTDISTGFNALNSLLAKMKQKYGGRKKILLLDEIGIMDDRNINILLTEIKRQVSEGEVIFAVLNLAERNLDHIVVEGIDV